MKKIVVFGGGTGLSALLSGLKLFPLDVTTAITVSDNGSSKGVLRRELDIPAVGDIGKDNRIRHDAVKTAFLIFQYLMDMR